MRRKNLVNSKDIFHIGLVMLFTIVGVIIFEFYRIRMGERAQIDTYIPEVIITQFDTKIFEALRKRVPPSETLPALQTTNETDLTNENDRSSSSMDGGSSFGAERTSVGADPTLPPASFPTPTVTISPLPPFLP
jgi:hypothetical protein